jgi:hypothetical protein
MGIFFNDDEAPLVDFDQLSWRELSHDTRFAPSRAAAARFISSAAGTPLTAGTSPLIS